MVKSLVLKSSKLFGGLYEGRRVLVTGHTGFKGAWLSFWLSEMGADVIGYALEPPTDPNLYGILDLGSRMRSTIADIRDYEGLTGVISKYKPEIVFHLAAQPLVRLSYQEPRLTYEVNVMGAVNVMDAVRQSDSVRVLVNVTSDKCYNNVEWEYAYRENDPMGGFDPYSSSKGCSELITSAYRSSFFSGEDSAGVATVRAGNVVGGGDWAADRIVPDCIRALSAGEAVKVRNPFAIRPWQHVLEPLSGYLWLASLLYSRGHAYAGGWNFGPPSQSNVTVREIVSMIIKSWGQGECEEAAASAKLHEARFLKLDCTKANNLLKWYPVYDIQATMDITAKWYSNYYHGTDMRQYTQQDISDYVDSAISKGAPWAVPAKAEEVYS